MATAGFADDDERDALEQMAAAGEIDDEYGDDPLDDLDDDDDVDDDSDDDLDEDDVEEEARAFYEEHAR